MATTKQENFIHSLLDERDLSGQPNGPTVADLHEQVADLTVDQASKWITRLLDKPKLKQSSNGSGPEPTEDDAGMYVLADGTIVRVYLGQNRGFMLAKKLVDTGRPHPEDSAVTLHEWEYMGKASRFIKGARRMELAEAKEYGRMTGSCCSCGRRLDVPESVEAGIGPVCAKKAWWQR